MAYNAATAEARKILDAAIGMLPNAGEISKGGSIYLYCSSHAGADITGAAFFAKCGAQPYGSSGPTPYESVARSSDNVGMRVGDLLVNIESSGGANAGKVTWHAVTASTLASGGGAYDVTVSST